jgi:O-antigen/teichoic acid export membrane protein
VTAVEPAGARDEDEATESIREATRPANPSPSAWRSVIHSAGARVLVMPFTAVLGILNTRLVIEAFGRNVYAAYGLLVGIGTLLPFADLGMSAAIMNAVGGSDHPTDDRHVHRVLVTSIRVLSASGTAIIVVAGIISLGGWWPTIMGDGLLPGSGGANAAGLCLAVIGLTLPIAFGQRVLTGVGRNHIGVIVTGMQTPIVLGVIWFVYHRHLGTGHGAYLPVIPYLATALLALVCTIWAARLIHPAIGRALRDVPRLRRARGERVFDVAWPMLIQMIALPIAMQTDELVLSHVSTSKSLAEYNLASSLYLPVWQVVSAAGVALWPIFARARARGDRAAQSPMPLAAGFGAAGMFACLVLSLLSGWLTQLASGGKIHLTSLTLISFSIFMIFQAAKYPLGMYMTDAPGLRYQAYMIVAMVPVNFGLSVVLARAVGTAGPIIGSAVGVFFFQLVANWWYVRRSMRLARAVVT